MRALQRIATRCCTLFSVTRGLPAALALIAALAACGGESSVAVDSGPADDATVVEPDGPTADAPPADLGLPPDAEPLANVFAVSPSVDERKTTQVTLAHLSSPERTMTGEYANVFNCLNKDGGDKISVNWGTFTFTGKVCKIEKTAAPGQDGTYLHIVPSDDSDGDDPFAEVNMYHHMTATHDYYKDVLGVTHMDKPLRALVNVMAYVDVLGSWMGIVNAAYVPKETGTFLQMFGVNLNDGEDAIIFAQGDTADPAYDGTVVAHEYTHAVIGRALFGNAHDEYGLDPTPGALNEGLADYFAASRLDTPVIGEYTMAPGRDVRREFSCPEHLVGEMHQDGEIVGNAMWQLRALLGAQTADRAIMNAVVSFTLTTTFEQASAALLDEIKALAPGKEAEAQAILEKSGLIGCTRMQEYAEVPKAGARLNPSFAGISEAPAVFAKTGVPSFVQYRVTVAPTTKELTIEYKGDGMSMMGLVPGGPVELSVALRKGSEPITYDYTAGTTSTAHAVLKGPAGSDGVQRLVVSGACVGEGHLVLQLLNFGGQGGQLSKLKVTQSDTVTAAAPNFDACP